MKDKLAKRSQGIQQSSIRAVTRRIEAVRGINLGQGNCDLPPHPEVIQAAQSAIEEGHNSYTLFDGIAPLKEAIVERCVAYNGLDITDRNVLVTGGATGAFECICKGFLEPGDEVIMFEPIYQYHVRQVRERGAILRYIKLNPPDWSFSVDELEAAFSERTKLFVFANPNNPCGKVFSHDELLLIGDTCRKKGVIAVVDEVYEYIISDGAKHLSLASLPGMFEHTLTVSSASKTLFVTGWRVGWLIAPEAILDPLGVKSDETYVCAPAPLQHAVAQALRLGDDFFNSIRTPFSRKRNLLSGALVEAGFKPYNPEGAYYTLADYRPLGFKDDVSAMVSLIEQVGIGAVPGNSFFPSEENTGMLRFCFALSDDQIERACEMLTSRQLAAAC